MVALLRHEEAVVGGIGYTNFDLWASGQRPQNFYMLGSMGLAVPIGMGVALAQPQRKVIALEGDGSILMQLGSLATVAARRQRNLAIVIIAALEGAIILARIRRDLTPFDALVLELGPLLDAVARPAAPGQ